jgi:bis(5'-nucleosyl)-tetraphosphatase (symmetrical)
LEQAEFDPHQDVLWCAGDIVNRGPQSLETLRYLYALGDAAVVVLGNHDLHLLAVAYQQTSPRKKDTLKKILRADDREELLSWLRRQKLMHVSADKKYLLCHAGLPPIWSPEQALSYAREIEVLLQSEDIADFLHHMYGNQPRTWNESLQGPARWRLITNYLTRMRFCDSRGKLELDCKLGPTQAPKGYQAWYKFPHQLNDDQQLLFGHWAAVDGNTGESQFIALDTGCVWGGRLSMLRLDDKRWFRCDC